MEYRFVTSRGKPSASGDMIVNETAHGNIRGLSTRLRMENGSYVVLEACKKYVTGERIWYRVEVDRKQYATTIMALSLCPEWAVPVLKRLEERMGKSGYFTMGPNHYVYPLQEDITPSYANGYTATWHHNERNDGIVIVSRDGEDLICLEGWSYRGAELSRHISDIARTEFRWANVIW